MGGAQGEGVRGEGSGRKEGPSSAPLKTIRSDVTRPYLPSIKHIQLKKKEDFFLTNKKKRKSSMLSPAKNIVLCAWFYNL